MDSHDTALRRTDLATPEQAAVGVEAYLLHYRDTGGGEFVSGWVCSPAFRPQWVGGGGSDLEERVRLWADDIFHEVTAAGR